MKLEITHRKEKQEKNNGMETKQQATKNQWVNDEIEEKIKKKKKTISMKTQPCKNL